MTSELRIAFIGLGRMGSPMAARLATAGWPVAVANRTPGVALALADQVPVRVAADPADAAADADVVITMLADADALASVMDGERGVLSALRPGAIVMDMGTSGPEAVRRLGPRVEAAGGILLDAPVSGSTAAAEAGTLTIMVGGPDEAVERVGPVLAVLGSRVFPMGGSGTGALVKLAVNLVIFSLAEAVAEALDITDAAGLDRTTVYDVLQSSAAGAPMVAYRREAFLDPAGTPPAFALTLAAKDLALLTDLADGLGCDPPQAAAVANVIAAAIAAGYGEEDLAALAPYLTSRRREPPAQPPR